jgi:hypothetical protein
MHRSLVLALLLAAAARADTHTPPTPAAACSTAALDDWIAHAAKHLAAVRTIGHLLGHWIADAPDDACRVRLFERFWTYYGDMQVMFAAHVERLDGAKRASLLRTFKEFGWIYHDSEAGAYISDGSDWLLRTAGPALPTPFRDYLTLRLRDTAEGFAEDAGLRITWAELRQRLRRWEDFDASISRFERSDEVHARLQLYLATLLTGLDNTPAFDRETGAIDKELRKEIETYLRDPQARSRKVVRGYYDLMVKSGFRSTPALDEYVAAHDLVVHGEPPRY